MEKREKFARLIMIFPADANPFTPEGRNRHEFFRQAA
jgi:hypothetical protein